MPITRAGDSADQAGGVSTIAAVSPSLDTVTTAVRTNENTLKLITWRINNDGSIDRLRDSGDDPTGEIEDTIGLAHVGFGEGQDAYYVAAVRGTSSGFLEAGDSKLISWAATDLQRLNEIRVGFGGFKLRPFPDVIRVGSLPGIFQDSTGSTRLLVAAERSFAFAGRLDLAPSIIKADGSFEGAPGSPGTDAGPIEADMSFAVLRRDRIATSVRTAQGNLLVIAWNVEPLSSPQPTQTSRLGDGAAGAAQLIRSAVAAQSGHLITSVRTGDGNLKLISWQISPNGFSVARVGDSANQAGAILSNALVARPNSNGMISAIQTQERNLRLIAWDVSGGGQINRREDSGNQAGRASEVTAVVAGGRIVTAVRTGEGNLMLIAWEIQ